MENKDILKHLEKAERYDALGFYSFADEIFNNLKPYIQNLPKEAQLRIMSHKKFGPQSAASIENTKGFLYLKGGEYAYFSGKGQQAFKDMLPMDMIFS